MPDTPRPAIRDSHSAEIEAALAVSRERIAELEQKLERHESALQKLASFEKAIETTRAGVTISDANGTIIYTNPAEAEMHGYASPAELVGLQARVLAPSDLWNPMSLENLEASGPFSRDSVNVRKDGSRFPVFIASDLVRDDDGKPVGVVSICQDITESKRAENELRKAFGELKLQAKESSVELSDALKQLNQHLLEQKAAELEKQQLEAELRQAQKMEAVGLLAGGVAHDFNNILTAIVGYGNLISGQLSDDDPKRSDLMQILEAAERGANLTQRLLTFSRKQMLDLKPVDANTLVHGVDRFLRRVIGEHITLKADLAEDALTVLADRGQLEQVLINLATNARDAMPNGGRLDIKTERVQLDQDYARHELLLEPGDYLSISVQDSGTGIAHENLEQIFEPFFTTKELGSGTGLGLAVSYGIVKQHHGAISVYSELGHGTLFRIYLPLTEAPKAATEVPDELPVGGTETILLAEDDETIRLLASKLLTKAGYTVHAASDGNAALELFAGHADEIELAVLDVILPGKHGPEVAEVIAKRRPLVPILFMSGYTADVLRSHGIDDQKMHYLQKPYNPASLLRKIRKLLDAATRQAAS